MDDMRAMDFQHRVQQARALAQLAGLELGARSYLPPELQLVLLAQMGLDQARDWLALKLNRVLFLLAEYPQYASRLYGPLQFDGWQWTYLLKKHPQLIRFVPDLNCLSALDWSDLVRAQPQFRELQRKYHPVNRQRMEWWSELDATDEANPQ
jgi:hypothetical protein